MFSSAGQIVTLRVSKTDQEKSGRRIDIPFDSAESACPVRALREWLETAQFTDGLPPVADTRAVY